MVWGGVVWKGKSGWTGGRRMEGRGMDWVVEMTNSTGRYQYPDRYWYKISENFVPVPYGF